MKKLKTCNLKILVYKPFLSLTWDLLIKNPKLAVLKLKFSKPDWANKIG